MRLERTAELIKSDPAAAAERLEAAMVETDRLQRLVEGLLVLSRAENTERMSSEVFDLVAIAKERIESWEYLAAEKGVSFSADFPKSAMVKALPGAVEQVIDNYIDNALEVVPNNSIIEVQIEVSETETTIHVCDAGPGMSESDLAKAFNRFWRARSDAHGSGLGLAIVDRLVKASGGHVALSNRETGGLVATATFPTA